jgi:hypothetical protein
MLEAACRSSPGSRPISAPSPYSSRRSLCVGAAVLAPFAALYGQFAVAGRPILFALLDLFEWWARLIGAIPPA